MSISFVSAEGQEERAIPAGKPGNLEVIAAVMVEQGDLRLEVLRPNGDVALAVSGIPDGRSVVQGVVSADENGELRYRVNARGARNGTFQIFFTQP